MASNSELKQRKPANGNAKSHPPPKKLENSHIHGSKHTEEEEEEHGNAEAGMIWDALRGRGSCVCLYARAMKVFINYEIPNHLK
jgi:hypothetical protein